MAFTDHSRRAARTQDERVALVAAVAAAGSHELEHDWVEWKTGVDLSQRRWHAEIAAQITGFANRHPDTARIHGEGCAYLLCGVEPRNIEGVTPIDNADLTDGVRRFLDGPRWSPAYEPVGGKTVLVITVEPPAWGDPIYSLRREFSQGNVSFREVPYMRRPGQTEPARHSDLEMLQKRLLASPPLDLQLVWVEDPQPLSVAGSTAGQTDAWVEAEERDLLGYLDRPEAETVAMPLAVLASGLDLTKKRSPAEYREDVAKYIEMARRFLPAHLVGTAAAKSPFLRLGISNATDRNFSEVQAEVKIEGRVMSFFDNDERELLEVWPARPWPFGQPGAPAPAWMTNSPTGLPAFSGVPARFRGSIDNSGSTKITFAPKNVRPRQQNVPVEPVRIVALGDWRPGDSITASWELTARDATGVSSGTVILSVGDVAVRPDSLGEVEATQDL